MTASLVCADVRLQGTEVEAQVGRCATSLRAAGVGEGDAVGLLLRLSADGRGQADAIGW